MKNGQNSIRLIPRHQSEWIWPWIDPKWIFNPNHFNLKFIRIDPNWKFGLDQCELGFIRIEYLDRIDALDWIGLIRIEFWPFSSNETQNVFDWFGMTQKQIPEWLNGSKELWFARNKFQSNTFARNVLYKKKSYIYTITVTNTNQINVQ